MTSRSSPSSPAPVEGDAVAVARLHVAVDAVVGDVELAAHEPLGERRVGPVEDLVPLLVPVQRLRLLGPEALRVGLGLLPDVRRRRPAPARGTPPEVEALTSSSCSSSCRAVAPSAMDGLSSGPSDLLGTLGLRERLLGAQPGLRAHVQLVEAALRACSLAQQRPDDAAEEAERDRDDARVGERPADRRARLESAPGHTFGLMMIRKIADTTPRARRTAPGGVEAPPGQRQQQRREVRARRDREGEADHERDVQASPPMIAISHGDDADRRAAIFATQTSSCSESLCPCG